MNIAGKRFTVVGIVVAQHIQPVDQLVTYRLLWRNVNMRNMRVWMMAVAHAPVPIKPVGISSDTTHHEDRHQNGQHATTWGHFYFSEIQFISNPLSNSFRLVTYTFI